jgi:hypothetical protein
MRYLIKYNNFNEDINIDKSNLPRLIDHFYKKDLGELFNDDFIQNISNMCLELDDLGNQINFCFPTYHKEGHEVLPCLSVDVDSQPGFLLDNKALEMTIKEIESYVSDFNLSIDIEHKKIDEFVSVEEFLTSYNTEELESISILIY